MKKILLILISSIFFYNISYAEEYTNSWKLEIECKDRGYKWWEAAYVVELIDNKFSLKIEKNRIGWRIFYYELYEAMYLNCASKGPKVGGDHAQEAIDTAVPFFVEALKWKKRS